MHLIFQQKNPFGADKNEFKVSQSSNDNQYVNTDTALEEFKKLHELQMEEYLLLCEQEKQLAIKRSAILKELKLEFSSKEFQSLLEEKFPEWGV